MLKFLLQKHLTHAQLHKRMPLTTTSLERFSFHNTMDVAITHKQPPVTISANVYGHTRALGLKDLVAGSRRNRSQTDELALSCPDSPALEQAGVVNKVLRLGLLERIMCSPLISCENTRDNLLSTAHYGASTALAAS